MSSTCDVPSINSEQNKTKNQSQKHHQKSFTSDECNLSIHSLVSYPHLRVTNMKTTINIMNQISPLSIYLFLFRKIFGKQFEIFEIVPVQIDVRRLMRRYHKSNRIVNGFFFSQKDCSNNFGGCEGK